MIFASFVVGMIVGSVLSSVALLLAIGITSQHDDEREQIEAWRRLRERLRNEDP